MWRGEPVSLRAAAYVVVITPAWLVTQGIHAYELAKVESAVLCSLTALPVWVLARRMVEPRLALLTAATSVAGTWMVTTAGILTENLALPLATAAVVAAVFTIIEPTSRARWLMLGFLAGAVAARIQLVVLVPALLLAFAIDVLRAGAGWRERVNLQKVPLCVLGLAVAAGAMLAAVAGSSITGIYSDVLDYAPGVGVLIGDTGIQLAELATMSAFVPVALCVVAACQRAAWRDELAGPLLTVFIPVAACLCLETGFFVAGNPSVSWGIERYVSYAAPLGLVTFAVLLSRPALTGRSRLAVPVALSLALIARPAVHDVSEERAVGATVERVRDIVPGASTGVALGAVALIVCAAVAAAVVLGRRRWGPAGAALVGVASVLLILSVQSFTAWSWQLQLARDWRTNFPSDLQWVDHHARGDVGVLEVTSNAVGSEQYDFFNTRIARYYAAPGQVRGRRVLGRVCRWHVKGDGSLLFDRGCNPAPRTFFINDPAAKLTFQNAASVVSDPLAGDLVTVNEAPRLLGMVVKPCERPRIRFQPPFAIRTPAAAPAQCVPFLLVETWLKKGGTVVLTFRGGATPHRAAIGQHVYDIPALRQTVVRVPVQAGAVAVQVRLDWNRRSSVDPAFAGAAVKTDAGLVQLT
jgi:hypothetical protein